MPEIAMPVVNWWVVLGCGVAAMVVGMLWYGPLFGKTYMRLMGMDPKNMKKGDCAGMTWCYIGQFVLSLVQAYVLIHVTVMSEAYYHAGFMQSAMTSAFWLWLGFVVPFSGSASLWSNKSTSDKWTGFWISV